MKTPRKGKKGKKAKLIETTLATNRKGQAIKIAKRP